MPANDVKVGNITTSTSNRENTLLPKCVSGRRTGHPAAQAAVSQLARACAISLLSLSHFALAPKARAEEKRATPKSALSVATDLLPDTTVAFAHIPSVGVLIDAVLDHPLRETVESLPEVATAKKSKEFTAFLGGVALFEASMTMPWTDTVKSLTKEGLFVAVDPATDGVIALAKGNDRKITQRFIETVISTARILGRKNVEVREVQYDRFKAYAIGDLKMAVLDDWLLVTNKSDLGKAVLDHYATYSSDTPTAENTSLSRNAGFQTALQNRKDAAAWAFLDIAAIRNSGVAPKLYSGASENILVEAILGGVLSNLAETPHMTAQLAVDAGNINLSVHLPHDNAWIGQREYFFGPNNHGMAPDHVEVSDRIASLTAYRDLAEMWLRAGDLLIEKAADELATADSTLSTFFSGRDFGEDILGGLASEIQLVVSQQTFTESMPKPVIKLPAFALQFKMLDPEKMRPDMRRVFISLFGFLNVVGAMEGQPQLDFAIESLAQGEVIATHYIPPDKENAAPGNTFDAAVINYNFSPSVGFAGDRIIVSSSSALAKELVTKQSTSPAVANDTNVNTSVQLLIPPIVNTLRENREQLVAQNMLEKGHDRQAAVSEIDLLLNLLALVKDAQLELTTDEDLTINLDVHFATE